MAYGIRSYVQMSFQDSFGTANISSSHPIPILSETLTETKPPLMDEGMYGRFDQDEAYEGLNEIAGEVVFHPNAETIGIALLAWAGANTAATSVDGVGWQYEITPESNDFENKCATIPLTVEVYRDVGSSFQYYDMCCNELSLEIANGEIVKATMGLVGGKYAKMTETTSLNYYMDDSFLWDTSSVSMNGIAADEVTAYNLTLSNNLEATGTLNNTKLPSRIKRTAKRSIELSGTLLYEDDVKLDLFRAGTVIQAINTMTINSGYTSDSLEIDIPSFKYSAFPVNAGGVGLIEVAYSGLGSYNAGSGTAIKFTLINSLDGY